MAYSLCHDYGTKKASESSTVVFTEFMVTQVLHTARICNVESTVCDNREKKMTNFELGKK